MVDPFLLNNDFSTEELLQLLINYEFLEPIYHSDGFGHVQEEIPLDNNLYSLSGLIEQVELKQLWPDFKLRLAKQPEPWLMDFSAELQKEKGEEALQCLVDLIDFFTTAELKLNYLLRSHEWNWYPGALPLIDTVIEQLTEIKINLQQKPAETESWEVDEGLNLRLVQQTLDDLNHTQASLCSPTR